MEITDSFTHINVDSGQFVDRDRILSPGEETVRERDSERKLKTGMVTDPDQGRSE